MLKEKKLKPAPDAVYRVNIWFWKLMDLIWNPSRHITKIPLKEGMVVVDYGCGPGRYTLPAARLVGPEGKVFAVDIQPLAIKTVKEKAAGWNLTNVEALLVDSYNTGIQDSTADMVLLIDTLHRVNNPHALFREIHRVLKQEGLLFMDPGHLRMSKAKEILEKTGFFTILECRGQDMLVAPKKTGF